MSKGKLIVISGASGVGKGTVLALAMEKRKDLSFSVSATTRDPRPGEVDGKHYFFISKECFEEMIKNDEFLEYDAHAANYYGTLKGQAEAKMKTGHVLLDIEPKGAAQVRKAAPDATLIFIMPPSMEELERRLRGRGDTSEEQIALRMERAVWEMEQRIWYDHVVVNDDANRCADEILSIISNLED
jgi:guanylate kinase